jgi:hypothetical protein
MDDALYTMLHYAELLESEVYRVWGDLGQWGEASEKKQPQVLRLGASLLAQDNSAWRRPLILTPASKLAGDPDRDEAAMNGAPEIPLMRNERT